MLPIVSTPSLYEDEQPRNFHCERFRSPGQQRTLSFPMHFGRQVTHLLTLISNHQHGPHPSGPFSLAEDNTLLWHLCAS